MGNRVRNCVSLLACKYGTITKVSHYPLLLISLLVFFPPLLLSVSSFAAPSQAAIVAEPTIVDMLGRVSGRGGEVGRERKGDGNGRETGMEGMLFKNMNFEIVARSFLMFISTSLFLPS